MKTTQSTRKTGAKPVSSAQKPSTDGSTLFDSAAVEAKWQQLWKEMSLQQVDIADAKKPFYNLMMFPYPSAEGLHVGNMYAFTGSDIYGRFKRMQGYDVFEPIGLDGFGIHSENFALKIGRHPMDHAQITQKNYYAQLTKIGAMFDWSRTVETYDTDYYRWTQWLFTQMFKHSLAYRDKASVNWCPSCKTVLADEQVIDGSCERCGNTVEKRLLEQWFFRITAYAGKLLENSFSLDWSEKVRVAQKNWIGKKEGINITYPVFDKKDVQVGSIECFTTRPDTNFGATFVVLAPEHPFISQVKTVIKNEQLTAIAKYQEDCKKTSENDRVAVGRKKTGVATGLYCKNQLTGYKMPLYISDFVLMGFGTGAVVGVPGHDVRDFEFAKAMNLDIIRVVKGPDGDQSDITSVEQVQEDEGVMMNSEFLNGMDIHEATEKMMGYLEEKRWGKRVVTYHLRDWLISRQRYWGPPIPMMYCQSCADHKRSWFTSEEAKGYSVSSIAYSAGKKKTAENTQYTIHNSESMAGWYPVPDADLPVVLPRIEDYRPGDDGVAPLAKHTEFFEVTCPACGEKARRETDVSDTFLDSSWYFLRYPTLQSENSGSVPFDSAITKKWLPVNMYTGGAEHSVLHLMYSRFVTMALHDWGFIDFDEPFSKFYAHGLVIKDGAKMSKSKGNVVNPDEYIRLYGADALRLYLMFMGPFDQGGDFRDTAMEGMSRWVGRIWRLVTASLNTAEKTPVSVASQLQRLIQKVTDDLEKRRYNTAIASMMEFTNAVSAENCILHVDDAKQFVQLVAPFAPHITEELWSLLCNIDGETMKKSQSIHASIWPVADVSRVIDDVVTVVVQINGKVRDMLPLDAVQSKDKQVVESKARQSQKVQAHLESKAVRTVIFVPGKILNFVVS